MLCVITLQGASFCSCNPGFSGDGFTCTDIDECTAGTDSCDANANCTNTIGSFNCACNQGYSGDGTSCSGGVSLVATNFTIGSVAMVTCTSEDGVAERIEIVMEAGSLVASQASVEMLTLTLDRVTDTLHGTSITCFVARDTGMATHSVSNQTLAITVNVPSDPMTATVRFNDSMRAVAGSEFSLSCVVDAIPGFSNVPFAEWRDSDGNAVVSGRDVLIQAFSGSRTAVSILTFSRLKATDSGRYSCNGRLTTLAQPQPLQVSTTHDLQIQISTPAVTLSLAPNSSLLAGGVMDTIFTCTAMVDEAVVNLGTLLYAFTWLDSESNAVVSGGRTIISSAVSSPSQSSTLTLSPLSTADTSFTCAVVVSVMEEILDASAPGVASTVVNVTTPTAPLVEVGTGRSIVGSNLSLTCTITLLQPLRASPMIVWTRGDGMEIRNGTLDGVGVSIQSPFTGVLTFSPLLTGHEGIYACQATIVIPSAGVFINSSSQANITIQVPPPTVTITGSPVDSGFFTGLQLTLTCFIHIPQELLSESVQVWAMWTKNGSTLSPSSRAMVVVEPEMLEPLLYQSTLVLASLDVSMGDSGEYACTARINSSVPTTSVFTVAIDTAFFQLQLSGISDCQTWLLDNAPAKDADLVNALVENVAPRCGCAFSEDRITNRVFRCFPSSPHSVNFHAQLHGTLGASVSELYAVIEEWAASGVTLSVQSLSLTISDVCAVNSATPIERCPVEGTIEPTVATTQSGTTADSSPDITTTAVMPSVESPSSYSVIIAASVVAFVAIIMVALLIFFIVYLRHKHTTLTYKTVGNRHSLPPAPVQAVELSPLEGHHKDRSTSPVLRAITTEHDYEVKYSDAALEAQEDGAGNTNHNNANYSPCSLDICHGQTDERTSKAK